MPRLVLIAALAGLLVGIIGLNGFDVSHARSNDGWFLYIWSIGLLGDWENHQSNSPTFLPIGNKSITIILPINLVKLDKAA